MRRTIEQTPIINQLYRYWLNFRFRTDGYGRFSGVYETFEEARKSAPKTKDIGYDHANLAAEYQQMLDEGNWENSGRIVAGHDYPLIFWLSWILNRGEGHNIFDFGGNVGVHFYSYAKYLNYPEGLNWTICEVPEIAKIGKIIAGQRGVRNLHFTCEFQDIEDKDVFIGSGSIQYVEKLANQLSLHEKPKHILINRLPIYDGEQFVTLQNGGKVFYPQYVFNKTEFIKEIENIGYKLVDIWENQGDVCIIPFHPDKSIHRYYGLYFRFEG